jgi:hypothetical protein
MSEIITVQDLINYYWLEVGGELDVVLWETTYVTSVLKTKQKRVKINEPEWRRVLSDDERGGSLEHEVVQCI